MVSSDDLSTSAMLCGWNFYEWQQRAMAILRVHKLDCYVHSDTAPQYTDAGNRSLKYSPEIAAKALRSLVDPGLIKRVPVNERIDPVQLMHRLEAISTYFRIMDLPAEFRNQIYRLVFPVRGNYKRRQGQLLPNPSKTVGYHALTTTSSQIRAESLPIFYASSTFKFSSDRSGAQVAECVRLWMAEVVNDQARHLSAVSIKKDIKHTGAVARHTVAELNFTYTAKDGLQVQCTERLKTDSRTTLDGLIKDTKKSATIMGIPSDGRLILQALITNANMWKFETLLRSKYQ